MKKKKIESEKTLAYAVAFIFYNVASANFMIGKTMYEYINTVYDKRGDGQGSNTLIVVYNYKAMKYEVLNVSNDKIGGKEIIILP